MKHTNIGKVSPRAGHWVPAKLYFHFSLHFSMLSVCRCPYLLDDTMTVLTSFPKMLQEGDVLIITAHWTDFPSLWGRSLSVPLPSCPLPNSYLYSKAQPGYTPFCDSLKQNQGHFPLFPQLFLSHKRAFHTAVSVDNLHVCLAAP